MSSGFAVALTAGAFAFLACGPAWGQAVIPRNETRAALAAQIWGEGPGVTLLPTESGGVRLIYQSPSGQAGVAYTPSDNTVTALSPGPNDARSRKRAKLGYAITDRLELFVDLQKRSAVAAEPPLAQDWLPPEVRRPRTYAVGVAARW